MNTPKTPEKKLRIMAEYIGPIMKLDDALSAKSQNLLFAISGTGKSFLARGLRMFDDTADDALANHKQPSNLVSEESTAGVLEIYEGDDKIASLNLDAKAGSVDCKTEKYIFHVFTSDYVETELRRKQYELDGEINHEIIIGRENKELDEKKEALESLKKDTDGKLQALVADFNTDKEQLKKQYAINAALKEYGELGVKNCFQTIEKPSGLQPLQTISQQFKSFRDLPQNAQALSLPEIPVLPIDTDELVQALQTPVSASAVAEEIKDKISAAPSFFQTGLHLHEQKPDKCPFCVQDIREVGKQAIETYVAYFQDAEAKAQDALAVHHRSIAQAKLDLERFLASHGRASVQFEKLKTSFPSLSESAFSDIDGDVAAISALYDNFLDAISTKRGNLAATGIEIDIASFNRLLQTMTAKCNSNTALLKKLSELLENSDAERLKIQRDACRAFLHDFKEHKNSAISEIQSLSKERKALEEKIKTLEKVSGEKIRAREKVADTFQELITYVFGGKYNFDKDRFVVQRNKADMTRGGERTMSDGEKSTLAFCYFLAQTHLRVNDIRDYERLFFVVDDPVSSVSFDYVYSICQILKTLRIENGELTFTGNNVPRPQMLILTHHDYFYNVVGTNNVIAKEGLFQLVDEGGQHKVNSQKGFVSPHVFHLEHILAVATGTDQATYGTPNSIRSVLESMWRFTRPDLGELRAFLTYVTNDLKLSIKSVLINDLSHGGKLSVESPLEDDIKAASKEAVRIVQKLAPGQVPKDLDLA